MEKPDVSQDDILDVMEMTEKLESYISQVLKGSELSLSISALMSATINCILIQCKNVEEANTYRDIFTKIFDYAIKSIKIKMKNLP